MREGKEIYYSIYRISDVTCCWFFLLARAADLVSYTQLGSSNRFNPVFQKVRGLQSRLSLFLALYVSLVCPFCYAVALFRAHVLSRISQVCPCVYVCVCVYVGACVLAALRLSVRRRTTGFRFKLLQLQLGRSIEATATLYQRGLL
ncbi:Uncharacterized protein APZ42_023315 [Daphnia magna]|uniref:Uncharacterized protein n=1 Tax=Daphnia magna TaxID=35525 RepID=A0A164V233_9CRUS|nr:Uncharacterized protein APZ42_023315 [Daphnia magna]